MIEIKAGQFLESETGKDARTCSILYPLEGRNGFIFCLIASDKRFEKDIKEICSILDEEADELSQTFEKDTNCQHKFEQFLAIVNDRLAKGASKGTWHMPIETLNTMVGIACDGDMYLSGSGELTALFLHKTPQQRYQVFNLARGIQTEQSLLTWEKPFAIILDGHLKKNDVFCLASRELKTSIENEELHTILSTLNPEGAAAKIRQYFPHNAALSILILKAKEIVETEEATAKPHSSLSVEKLGATESETDRLLEDQSPKSLLRMVKRLPERLKRNEKGPRRRLHFLAKIGAAGIAVWAKAQTFIRRLNRTTREGEDLAARVRENRRQIARKSGIRGIFYRLPRSAKYFAFAAIGILLIFATSVSVLSRTETKTAEIDAFQEQVDKIVEKQEQGAAALIYKDENQARGFYISALNLVTELQTINEEQAEEKIRLQNQINTALDELRHIITIPDPPIFVTLPETSSAETLVQDGENFYVIADEGVFEITEEKEVIRFSFEEIETGRPLATTTGENGIFFLDDRPGLSELDVARNDLSATIHAPQGETSWVDLKLYNRRLYVLEPELGDSKGQILKFNPGGANFAAPQKWLQSKTTNLSDAVGLAIDGTIFVLKETGEIVRFQSGSQVGWAQGIVDPAITNARKIWTDNDSDFLYVLEPDQKRLIVYKKENGAFLTQYRSERFTDMTDMVINESESAVYLTSGPTIFRITMNHLNEQDD